MIEQFQNFWLKSIGNEVADFVKEHMVDVLKNLESFKEGKYEQALRQVNEKIDDLLRTPYGKAKLASYKVRGEGGSPEAA